MKWIWNVQIVCHTPYMMIWMSFPGALQLNEFSILMKHAHIYIAYICACMDMGGGQFFKCF